MWGQSKQYFSHGEISLALNCFTMISGMKHHTRPNPTDILTMADSDISFLYVNDCHLVNSLPLFIV